MQKNITKDGEKVKSFGGRLWCITEMSFRGIFPSAALAAHFEIVPGAWEDSDCVKTLEFAIASAAKQFLTLQYVHAPGLLRCARNDVFTQSDSCRMTGRGCMVMKKPRRPQFHFTPSNSSIVAVEAGRAFCKRSAVASAWRNTRSMFSPASFLRSASLQPRRINSANK